jgi:hypothetical protein
MEIRMVYCELTMKENVGICDIRNEFFGYIQRE